MRWFDQWFARKCRWAWENPGQINPPMTGASLIAVEEDSTPWQDDLRITIKKMIGGYVVSFKCYDRRGDRTDTRNYIITDEQDFNTELGKIITMESMRQAA